MKDLNFFEPYIEKDFKISKALVLGLVGIVLIVGLLAYSAFNQMKLSNLKAEAHDKRLLAEDEDIARKVERIKVEEDELNQFAEEVASMRDLNDYIEESDLVNTDFISQITSKMPRDMFLTSFNITNQSVDIHGISQSKLGIAEFQKGLSYIEPFEEIFISNITREEDHHVFTINILMKEVDYGGEDHEAGEEGSEEDKEEQ